MSMTYSVPRSITYGECALEALGTLKGARAMLVTGGSSMKKHGFLDRAQQILEQAGFAVRVFDGVEPNPSVETVQRGAKEMCEFKPDWIVAIGGGSAIDAAKIMWVFYEHPSLTFEAMLTPNSIPPLRGKARFAAIPSTSGTASEITAFSVITDTRKHIKYPIVSAEMVPDLAILDPALPATMPPHVTANTGMDVLAHALEAIASTQATSLTNPDAYEAARLVFEYLPIAYTYPTDMYARSRMHEASALAGMAFSNASLGLTHAMAHKLGGEFGLAHGLANAVLLPHIIEFNRVNAEENPYELLEDFLGVEDLAEAVRELNEVLGLPCCLRDCESASCPEDKFSAALDRMSQNALEDPCVLTNPATPSVDDVKAIYRAAYEGAGTCAASRQTHHAREIPLQTD